MKHYIPVSEYSPAHIFTPCCDTYLHRPNSDGKMSPHEGHWFCKDCGKTYRITEQHTLVPT